MAKNVFYRSVPTWVGVVIVAVTLGFWHLLVTHGRTEIKKQTIAETERVHDKIKAQVSAQIFAVEQMGNSWSIVKGMPAAKKEAEDFSAYFRGYAALEWAEAPFKGRWIIPFAKEEKPKGFDLSSEDMQARIYQAVMTKREVTMTQAFKLPDGGQAFMICRPVFAKGKSGNILVTVAVFRMDDLLDAILKDDVARGYSIKISEGSEPIYTRPEKGQLRGHHWRHQIEVSFPGTSWIIQVWPGPELLKQIESQLYAVFLLGSALLAFLLVTTIYFSQKSQLSAREIAEARQVLKQEIAERKRVQQDRSQLAAIVEHSDDAIIGNNLEGIITTWNRGAGGLFGYSPEEVIGKPFSILIPEPRRFEIAETLGKVKRGEEIERRETQWKRKDGSLVDVSVTISPIRNDAEEAAGFSVIARDITERRKAEELLKQQAEELARSNRELELFAAVASHDLQAPVQKILGFADLLLNKQEGRLDDKSKDYLERVVRSAERMGRLISDLLNHSKVSRSQNPFTEVDLNKVVAEVLSDLELRMKEKNAFVQKTALPVIRGDALQMHQLFQNLIANALKFHKKEEAPRISVGAGFRQDGFYEISVRDNGIGFDEKHLEKIFEPFSRLHSASEYEGSGIGLSTCQKIAARHGGRISASSVPGQGATFSLILPADAIMPR